MEICNVWDILDRPQVGSTVSSLSESNLWENIRTAFEMAREDGIKTVGLTLDKTRSESTVLIIQNAYVLWDYLYMNDAPAAVFIHNMLGSLLGDMYPYKGQVIDIGILFYGSLTCIEILHYLYNHSDSEADYTDWEWSEEDREKGIEWRKAHGLPEEVPDEVAIPVEQTEDDMPVEVYASNAPEADFDTPLPLTYMPCVNADDLVQRMKTMFPHTDIMANLTIKDLYDCMTYDAAPEYGSDTYISVAVNPVDAIEVLIAADCYSERIQGMALYCLSHLLKQDYVLICFEWEH